MTKGEGLVWVIKKAKIIEIVVDGAWFMGLWGRGGFFVRGVTILMEVGVVELDLKNENVHKINLKKLKWKFKKCLVQKAPWSLLKVRAKN